ncbi:MAG: hypothetical protein ACOC0T_07915 [Desulfovermiculus sp.]
MDQAGSGYLRLRYKALDFSIQGKPTLQSMRSEGLQPLEVVNPELEPGINFLFLALIVDNGVELCLRARKLEVRKTQELAGKVDSGLEHNLFTVVVDVYLQISKHGRLTRLYLALELAVKCAGIQARTGQVSYLDVQGSGQFLQVSADMAR